MERAARASRGEARGPCRPCSPRRRTHLRTRFGAAVRCRDLDVPRSWTKADASGATPLRGNTYLDGLQPDPSRGQGGGPDGKAPRTDRLRGETFLALPSRQPNPGISSFNSLFKITETEQTRRAAEEGWPRFLAAHSSANAVFLTQTGFRWLRSVEVGAEAGLMLTTQGDPSK